MTTKWLLHDRAYCTVIDPRPEQERNIRVVNVTERVYTFNRISRSMKHTKPDTSSNFLQFACWCVLKRLSVFIYNNTLIKLVVESHSHALCTCWQTTYNFTHVRNFFNKYFFSLQFTTSIFFHSLSLSLSLTHNSKLISNIEAVTMSPVIIILGFAVRAVGTYSTAVPNYMQLRL